MRGDVLRNGKIGTVYVVERPQLRKEGTDSLCGGGGSPAMVEMDFLSYGKCKWDGSLESTYSHTIVCAVEGFTSEVNISCRDFNIHESSILKECNIVSVGNREIFHTVMASLRIESRLAGEGEECYGY